jgi:hypothetical protein
LIGFSWPLSAERNRGARLPNAASPLRSIRSTIRQRTAWLSLPPEMLPKCWAAIMAAVPARAA